MKKTFTSDKYTKGRGNFSKRVEIRCVNCATTIFNYQKEGHGAIEKMYFDNILDNFMVKKEEILLCSNCEKVLGKRFVFGNEKKLAFKVYPGAIYYKIVVPKRVVFKRG
jgi:hypothetical protein